MFSSNSKYSNSRKQSKVRTRFRIQISVLQSNLFGEMRGSERYLNNILKFLFYYLAFTDCTTSTGITGRNFTFSTKYNHSSYTGIEEEKDKKILLLWFSSLMQQRRIYCLSATTKTVIVQNGLQTKCQCWTYG